MALQDLTPQLRTRLSHMERAVGWFVLLATLLLLGGFAYYLYTTAKNKGWFLIKVPYYTFTDRATGLKVGDPVQLMGLSVGHITDIQPQPPYDLEHNICIDFVIVHPYDGYLWTEGSHAKVTAAALDLLGKRVVEVTKGTNGYPTYIFSPLHTNTMAEIERLPNREEYVLAQEVWAVVNSNSTMVAKALLPLTNGVLEKIRPYVTAGLTITPTNQQRNKLMAVWDDHNAWYVAFNGRNRYGLVPDESPALTDRAERLVASVEAALPNILGLTNQLSATLSNSASMTSNLNVVAQSIQPVITNMTFITAQLQGQGTLGDWLIPTNMHRQLDVTLTNVNTTVSDADSNLVVLAESLTKSLNNLADVTSNLNGQVQANTNILTHLSDTIVHSDQFIQGLKHHWLLRSAFKTKKTNSPPAKVHLQLESPKSATEK
ncbi:MlaD family protein [Pedosphaera parvula]|uniref:Mammalian cell entry related domain protein n=1 Tax=Pedosphaera parvula (strain Ellin514) TaxID=320771 RepID=B9XHU5_PEDPL|nr:MlaD family protein [Pedosphaera parvula]EEF60673.1 Mammalian cell entry related domain protein [Pedosphaera parvula Ellin514]